MDRIQREERESEQDKAYVSVMISYDSTIVVYIISVLSQVLQGQWN